MSIVAETILAYYRDFPTWDAIATIPQSALAAASPGAGAKTDTQPVAEIGAAKSGALAASWGDLYFGWVHLVPSAIAMGYLLARREDTILVCNADLSADATLVSVDRENADGMTLSYGTPPIAIEPLKDLEVTLYTEMTGPANIAAAFAFNFDDGQSPDLACTGVRTFPFPFPPQAQLKEALAWLTDVNEAYDGTESREQVRVAPRQSFSGAYRATGNAGRMALKAIATGWQMRYFGYPVWPEAVSVGAVAAGATWIGFDTSGADYKESGYCLIFGGSWQSAELAAILSVAAGGLTLMLPVTGTYARASVMPVRIARMEGTPKYTEAARFTEAELTFAVEDNDPLSAEASAVQYLGFDTLLTPYGAPGQLAARRVVRPAEVLDGETGKVLNDPRGDWGRIAFDEAHFDARTRAEAWAYRLWLHRRAGRLRPVWVPTFERDIELSAGFEAGATNLQIDPIYYTQMLFGSPQYEHVAFFRTTGEIYLRRIVNAQELVDAEAITIDTALGFAGDNDDFDRICFLTLCRLSADQVEIVWERAGRLKSAVGLIGLDADSES